MALIICPECGKEISEYATSCIGCGCPMVMIEQLQMNQLQGTPLQKGMARFLEVVLGKYTYRPTLNGLPDTECLPIINEILETLTPREENVIKSLFGLKNGDIFLAKNLL